MSWFRVDDKSAFHAKVVSAGNAAWGAFVRMGAYCSDHLTDGFVTQSVARVIGEREIPDLIRAGLLIEVDDGYELHDYLEWNASSEKVLGISKKRRKAGRVSANTRANKRSTSGQHLVEQKSSKGVGLDMERSDLSSLDLCGGPGGVPAPPESAPTVEPPKLSSEQRYAAAWASGISLATTEPCMPPSRHWELGAINNAVLVRFKGLRGENLTAAIQASAREYARVRAGYVLSPEKWVEWLNSGRPGVEHLEPLRAPSKPAPPPPAEPISANGKAAVEAVLASMRKPVGLKSPRLATQVDPGTPTAPDSDPGSTEGVKTILGANDEIPAMAAKGGA